MEIGLYRNKNGLKFPIFLFAIFAKKKERFSHIVHHKFFILSTNLFGIFPDNS